MKEKWNTVDLTTMITMELMKSNDFSGYHTKEEITKSVIKKTGTSKGRITKLIDAMINNDIVECYSVNYCGVRYDDVLDLTDEEFKKFERN